MRYAVIALSLALLAAGCSKKNKQQPKDDTPVSDTESRGEMSEVEHTREAKRREYLAKKNEIKRRRKPMPITAADVEGQVPAIEGGESLGAPTADPTGRQVVSEVCVPGEDSATAAANLESALTGAGWEDINTRASRKGDGVGMSGRKGGLRLTAMIRAGASRCAGKQGDAHALMRFHKLVTKDQAAPPK